ncbi:MAG: very short patch repair endonuclease [Bacteroidetes bacterium]|nr:very short patch repair endonuclease [Bacteroidota bacterium]
MKTKYGFDTTRERSELMKKIRSINTTPEILLRKAIWNLGYRYRINVSKLPGKPDIVINKYKLIIFIDGEFWHGYKWKDKKPKIKANREYWIKKIEGNMARDKINTKKLTERGYTILRFWEHEIKKDLQTCLSKILMHTSSQ